MPRPIPIGGDDFRTLRERDMEYVDKSHVIREILDEGAQALLLPRPRRPGKTLTMTMLRCFFEKRADDLTPLFADLSIWQAGEPYRAHFQRYPVIFLTLKGIKLESFELAWDVIRKRLAGLFAEHRVLLDDGTFVIGLLATLDPEYEVRSNRESGHGRPDVMLRPKHAGKPGVVLELKVAKAGKKTLEQALAEGTAQIRERDYASELRAAGASPVYGFAVAFDGKHVRVAGA